jgi:transposase-like protein
VKRRAGEDCGHNRIPENSCRDCPKRVVRIFPNAESRLRLVRALAVETHKNWMEANRYIKLDDLLARHAPSRTMAAQIC